MSYFLFIPQSYFLFIPQSQLLAPFIGCISKSKVDVLVVQEGNPKKHWAQGADRYELGAYIDSFTDEGEAFDFNGIIATCCSLADEVGELASHHDLQAEFRECMKLAGNERGDVLAARISKFCKELVLEFEQNKIDEEQAEQDAANDAAHPQR